MLPPFHRSMFSRVIRKPSNSSVIQALGFPPLRSPGIGLQQLRHKASDNSKFINPSKKNKSSRNLEQTFREAKPEMAKIKTMPLDPILYKRENALFYRMALPAAALQGFTAVSCCGAAYALEVLDIYLSLFGLMFTTTLTAALTRGMILTMQKRVLSAEVDSDKESIIFTMQDAGLKGIIGGEAKEKVPIRNLYVSYDKLDTVLRNLRESINLTEKKYKKKRFNPQVSLFAVDNLNNVNEAKQYNMDAKNCQRFQGLLMRNYLKNYDALSK